MLLILQSKLVVRTSWAGRHGISLTNSDFLTAIGASISTCLRGFASFINLFAHCCLLYFCNKLLEKLLYFFSMLSYLENNNYYTFRLKNCVIKK